MTKTPKHFDKTFNTVIETDFILINKIVRVKNVKIVCCATKKTQQQ